MEAIQKGDLRALMKDGRIEALMKHPTVRSLSSELQQ
jgi:hypothetical protein